jgi:putative membrane protein
VIVWILIVGTVTAGIVLLVVAGIRRAKSRRVPPRRWPGLEILNERYARGEISRDEYLQKRNDILG